MKVAFIRFIYLSITQGLLTACWNLDCVEAKIFFNLCIDQNAGKFWTLAEVVDPDRLFFGCSSMNGTNVFQRSNIQTCFSLVFQVDKNYMRKTEKTKLFDRNIHQHVICFRISGFRLQTSIGLVKKSFQSDRNGLETSNIMNLHLGIGGGFGDITPLKNLKSMKHPRI